MPRVKKNSKVVAPKEVEEEEDEVELLKGKIANNIPDRGSQLTSDGLSFTDFALSKRTMEGLAKANITTPTDIQAAALPHALCGRDILGAAKTGSGKTLAFVIPVLELLYRERWGLSDGLAAIIITPTRELALQIFDVLRTVGKKHDISAGLVTGGKKEFEEEQERIVRMNILVATPGRLLQHFEQTPDFDSSNLLALVLDEADRILDMGFRHQLDSIVAYLPVSRQTLLFSATQTKSVKDLARLSLKQPEFLAVHAGHTEATPSQLKQNYVVCPLHQKLDTLFSFIKTHLKSKMIVFLSSCAQVRFVYECFRGMQPGIPLTALHGKIKQDRRTLIYMDFLRRKYSCLFATDVAARGLDFPDVDWVIQVDAPEDAAMYIHRVGRTARYKAGGRALMMLMPGEEKSVCAELTEAGVPVKRLSMNPNKSISVASRAAALLISNPDCRSLAKKCFVSYLKAVQMLPRNKGNGILQNVDTDAFSASLGLAVAPAVPVVAVSASGEVDDSTHKVKNVNRSLDRLKKQIKAAKEEKRLAAKGLTAKPLSSKGEDSDEEEFLVVKKSATAKAKESGSEEDSGMEEEGGPVVDKLKHKKVKPLKIRQDGESTASVRAGAKRIAFDDSGAAIDPLQKIASMTSSSGRGVDSAALQQEMSEHLQKAKRVIDAARKEDNARERERVREKHLKKKLRLNEADEDEDEEGERAEGRGGAFLVNAEEEDEEEGSGDSDSSDGGSSDGSDDDSEADSDEEEDYEESGESDDDGMAVSKYAVSGKRKNRSGSGKIADDVRLQEEMALKLLGK